jgi:uracil permease
LHKSNYSISHESKTFRDQLMDAKTDMGETRNQVIVSVVLTVGIGGAIIQYGTFSPGGIGLAALAGILLNLLLPQTKKED